MKLQVEMQVVTTHSNVDGPHGSRFVSISLKDKASRVEFLEIDMSFEDFGKLVRGDGVDLTAEVRGLDILGKVMEWKVVSPDFPKGVKWKDWTGKTFPPFEEAIAPFEVDGWTASRYHNSQGDGVTLRRYVDAPKEEG